MFKHDFDQCLSLILGLISIKSSLKCEADEQCLTCLKEDKICSLVIVATDGGQPQQSAQTVVKVALLDTNDHDPRISFKVLPDQSLSYASVNEKAKIGTSVAAITISDADKGRHGQAKLDIIKGNEKGHFEIQSYGSSLYVLRVSSRARFVRGSDYNLTMRANDNGIPPRFSENTLHIKVKEINEFSPKFAQDKYQVEVFEDLLPGSSVMAMLADDEDVNADLHYEIQSPKFSSFKIHPKSGLLTTFRTLDRETLDRVELEIRVSDGSHEAFTKIEIDIMDVNDEVPRFLQDSYIFEMEENFPLRQTFGQVQAIDNDLGEAGQVTYSIEDNDDNVFGINKISGELFANVNLDREERSEYKIIIKASDNGAEKQLSSTVQIKVAIKDVNDNSPVFYPLKYYMDLGGTPKDNPVIQLKALDADENSSVEYKLENGDLEYELEESSGLFKVNPRYIGLVKSERTVKNLQAFSIDNEGRKSPKLAQIHVYPFNSLQKGIFKSSLQEFDIVEDSQLGQAVIGRQVGQLSLLDNDQDIELEIVSGDAQDLFEVSNEGIIRTKQAIDREKHENFTLKVVAKNENGFDMTEVKILVRDLNDNIPKFDREDPKVLEIDLKAPIGHRIHRVLCQDPDEGQNGNLQFMLDDLNNKQVSIDQATGILELYKPLTSKESFEITVKVNDLGAQPLSNLKTYLVQVKATENDYTPMFDFDLYEVSLSESTALNSEVITMSAIDQDGEDNQITYALIDNNDENKFDILPDGKVYLVDKLDRESKAYYSVIVTATDNGLVPFARSSTSTLVIYVIDENDNAPILEKNEYVFYLKENQEPDTVIGRVSAYDLDLGRNAEINFKFANHDNDLFKIDKQTGFISSKTLIDRESLPTASFDLEVIVSDLGLVPQTTSANVLISILDENDNAPLFSQRAYDAEVGENANIGTEIISVFAKDIDDGINGQVEYEIISEDLESTFKIDKTSGKIYLQRQLDRETTDRFDIKIQAHDGGSPGLTSTCLVHVKVLDENDNKPVFQEDKISLQLNEDANVGDVMYEFKAKDEDVGVNGKISYSLVGNNINSFSVNSESGIMTLTSQLDREIRDKFELVVQAVDNGVYPKTGSVLVKIDIIDVNDNAPVITTTPSVINVKEGISIGTKIVKIDATDKDIGVNGELEFSMTNHEDVFKINSKTGDIVTVKEIDREAQDKYSLAITVKDKGVPTHKQVERVFKINIEDVNDNAPEITSLNTALILTGSPRGTNILKIKGMDADAGSNAAITYKLREPSRLVKLDPVSGQLSLLQDYQDQIRDPLSLTVIASDGAVPSVRKSSTTTITIIGSRPNPGLSFDSELYEATITENSPIGTPVTTVNLNGSPQERINYYIVGCESQKGKERGLFSIDKNSGQVLTSRMIDRELEGSNIMIHIIALIGSDKMSGTKVKINLQDENDSQPEFDPGFDLKLSEAYLPGHQLGFAKASDPDLNSILTYSLSLPSQNFMTIDAQSGELKLTSTLDREQIDQVEVVIYASDGQHTSEWTKLVKIQDVNDNAPDFISPQFSFDIYENVERGAFVGKIQAEDLDENEKITYSFISDWGLDTFSIDPVSGIISLSGNALDHESIEHYILTVSASDSGQPVLTATSTVYVNVKDINDNAPIIDKSLYEVQVPEDLPIGSSIVQIMAHDKDSDANTDLQYSLENGSVKDVFDILPNGTIVTRSRLDRETVNFFAFEVQVADSPNTQSQLISTCIVQVTILDVNDQVPLFENIERLHIVENSPANTPVAAIRAIDQDLGKNAEIEYLLEDSLGGKFSIGRIDGVLRSVKSLDREEQDIYQLSVTAIDNGSPR